MSETAEVRTLLSDPKVAITAMVVPLAVAILIQNLNSMTDTLWASWLGGDAVGGLGLAYPLYASICGVGNGLAIGASSAIARYVGLRDQENASRAAGQALTLAVLFSLLLALIFVPLAVPLMDAFGDGEAADEAVDYGIPIFAFGFFIISSSIMSGILRGEGAARASMRIQVAGAVTNIILDPVLMYGCDLGVGGAGWATVIAGLVSLLLGLMCYGRRNRMYLSLRVRDLRPDWALSKDILYVGLPESAEYVTMSMINIPMNFIIVGVGGADAVGIYTSAWRVAYMVLVPAQAYSGAVVSVCSSEYSRKRPDMIKEAFRFAVRKSVLYTVYTCLLLLVLAYPIAMVFTASSDLHYLREEMVWLFVCIAAMLPVMSQVFVGSSFLQSIRHSEIGFLSSLIRNIVMVSGYLSMAWIFDCDLAIWIIMALIEIFGGALMAWLAWTYIKRFERQCQGVTHAAKG